MKNLTNTKTVFYAFLFCMIGGMLLFLVCFNVGSPDIVDSPEYKDLTAYFSNFNLETADHSSSFGSENLSGHKITVFNGWAPWCTGCVNEMPDLQILSEEYADRGLQIIGVVPDYPEKVKNLGADNYDEQIAEKIQSTGVTYPCILADEEFYDKVYPSTKNSMPTTWIVNENGELLEIISGGNSRADWATVFDKWLSMS